MIIKPYIDDGSTVRSLFIWSLLMADFKIEIVFNKQFANSRQRTVTRSIFFAAHFLNRQKKKKKKIVEEEVHLLCLKPVLDFSLDAWNCLRIGIRIAI
jgi:hypothetical protein